MGAFEFHWIHPTVSHQIRDANSDILNPLVNLIFFYLIVVINGRLMKKVFFSNFCPLWIACLRYKQIWCAIMVDIWHSTLSVFIHMSRTSDVCCSEIFVLPTFCALPLASFSSQRWMYPSERSFAWSTWWMCIIQFQLSCTYPQQKVKETLTFWHVTFLIFPNYQSVWIIIHWTNFFISFWN